MKFGCSIGIFLNSAYLICRSTNIAKCFRGSLRLRDNESQLYFIFKNRTKQVSIMYSYYTGDHAAGDNMHTDITTCNNEEPQKKYRLKRSVKDYVGGGGGGGGGL